MFCHVYEDAAPFLTCEQAVKSFGSKLPGSAWMRGIEKIVHISL